MKVLARNLRRATEPRDQLGSGAPSASGGCRKIAGARLTPEGCQRLSGRGPRRVLRFRKQHRRRQRRSTGVSLASDSHTSGSRWTGALAGCGSTSRSIHRYDRPPFRSVRDLMKPAIIAPSILSADWMCLEDAIRTCESAGADWIHVDVMGWALRPNLTMGPFIVESAAQGRPVSRLTCTS